MLNLLYGVDEGLSQTQLSPELVMHRSNITGLVDRLEERGLLARKECSIGPAFLMIRAAAWRYSSGSFEVAGVGNATMNGLPS